MTLLSVNLNAVAQLRNRRDLPWPSVTGIARVVLDAGASGITVHPRPDERHIRRSDVYDLSALLREDYPAAEFNIEGYPSDDFLERATGGAVPRDLPQRRPAPTAPPRYVPQQQQQQGYQP